MATNITDVAFSEAATLQADFVAAVRGETSVQINAIEFVSGGVMITWGSSPEFRAFVPYSNIKAISHTV